MSDVDDMADNTQDELERRRSRRRESERMPAAVAAISDESSLVYLETREKRRADEGERNAALTERLGELIRRLKASRDPANERGLIRNLRELGHPDVDGLLGSLKAKAFKPRRGEL